MPGLRPEHGQLTPAARNAETHKAETPSAHEIVAIVVR